MPDRDSARDDERRAVFLRVSERGSMPVMKRGEKLVFTGIVAAQAAHSTEEYFGRLWELAPSARYVSGLISSNLETGFLIANAGFVAFGVLCLLLFVLPGRAGAGALVLFWAVIEAFNGAGHLAWAALAGGYRPGAVTAPVLLLLAVILLVTEFAGDNKRDAFQP